MDTREPSARLVVRFSALIGLILPLRSHGWDCIIVSHATKYTLVNERETHQTTQINPINPLPLPPLRMSLQKPNSLLLVKYKKNTKKIRMDLKSRGTYYNQDKQKTKSTSPPMCHGGFHQQAPTDDNVLILVYFKKTGTMPQKKRGRGGGGNGQEQVHKVTYGQDQVRF